MSSDSKKEVTSTSDAPKEVVKQDEVAAPPAPELKPTQFVVPALLIGIKYYKVDLTQYLWELRYAFAAVVALKFLIIAFLYMKASGNSDTTKVTVKEKGMDGVEKTKIMTVGEYDKSQVMKNISQALLALCMTCGIHYKWGNPTPLLFQCVMTPLGFLDDNLFKIYVLNQKAEGKLARPFAAAASPFAELMGKPAESTTNEETKSAPASPQRKKKSKKDD